MERPILKTEERNILGKKVKILRKEGKLPAVLYGKDVKNINLIVNQREFEEVFKKAGQNTIVSLDVPKEGKRNILIHKVERDPVTDDFIHIDFYQVKMTEKITAQVPLHFIGESLAVREEDGTLVKNKDEIEIECLPADLPHSIDVDISALDNFEASIHIKDLNISPRVEVLDDLEDTVAIVEPPRSEEELAELEEPVEEEIPEEEVKEGEKVTEEAEEGKEDKEKTEEE